MQSLNKYVPDMSSVIDGMIKIVDLTPLDKDTTFIAYPPSLNHLGNNIVTKYKNCFKLPIQWSTFPDGTPNMRMFPRIKDKDIIFLFDGLDLSNSLSQLMLLHQIPNYDIKSLIVIIPYYSVGTMERSEKEGVIATAESLAKIISSSLPCTQTGRPKIVLFDIHSIVEKYYFKDSVIPIYASGIDLLLEKIKFTLPWYSPHANKNYHHIDAIVFPDDGAFKRFKPLFGKNVPTIVCSKMRGDNGERILHVQEIMNTKRTQFNSVIIIDDLIQSGSTIIECCNAMKKKFGQECKVNVYATHGVFPNKSFLRLNNELFDKVYITDTILHEDYPEHFVVLDILDLLPKFTNLEILEEKQIKKSVDVVVTSSNKDKLYATYLHFLLKGHCNINLFYIHSDLNNKQIIGHENIKNELYNRSLLVKNIEMGGEYILVSIQNGILNPLLNSEFENYGDVCRSRLDFVKGCKDVREYPQYKSISYTVPILHKDYFKEEREITYGQFMSQIYGCEESDWYHIFDHEPRWYMVYDSLRNI